MSVLDQFAARRLPRETEPLRADIRAFIADTLKGFPATRRAVNWMDFDAAFSRKLGAAGFIGLTLPKEYGGGGKTAFDRYVVAEELLAAGAPVAAHWFADRQSGPLILRHGTEDQRRHYLPGICRGEFSFCIGMSEPDTGSDLASVRTRADRQEDGGWLLNGRKVWTSNAHHCHYMIALVRTTPGSERQQGLTQFIVNLKLPGVTIRPIKDLTGVEHFNEVTFDNVRMPADALIGVEGQGWEQVVSELAFERSGPDRWLSSMALTLALIDAIGPNPDRLQAVEIGRLVGWMSAFRKMSIAVTSVLASGEDPVWAASCVKDIGTGYEQGVVETANRLIDSLEPGARRDALLPVLAVTQAMAPSYSLRGGTREILRGIIARGLGLR